MDCSPAAIRPRRSAVDHAGDGANRTAAQDAGRQPLSERLLAGQDAADVERRRASESRGGSEAAKLAALVGATGAANVDNAQTALGLISMLVGSVIDRAFAPPSNAPSAGWLQQPLPNLAGQPTIVLTRARRDSGTFEFNPAAPSGDQGSARARLQQSKSLDGSTFQVGLEREHRRGSVPTGRATGPATLSGDSRPGHQRLAQKERRARHRQRLRWARSSRSASWASRCGSRTESRASRSSRARAKRPSSRPTTSSSSCSATASPSSSTSRPKPIAGHAASHQRHGPQGEPAGAYAADRPVRAAAHQPRSRAGRRELPASTASSCPLRSASLLGPFAASVDRLGVLLDLDVANAGRPLAFAFKPPNGIGLVARRGHRQGRRISVGRRRRLRGRARAEDARGRRQGDRDPQH